MCCIPPSKHNVYLPHINNELPFWNQHLCFQSEHLAVWTEVHIINVSVVAAGDEVLIVWKMLLPLGTSSMSRDCGTSKVFKKRK
jgi:hypothetical protein